MDVDACKEVIDSIGLENLPVRVSEILDELADNFASGKEFTDEHGAPYDELEGIMWEDMDVYFNWSKEEV